jgi:hypothetical protein
MSPPNVTKITTQWERKSLPSRKKQISGEVLSCAHPVPDLARQLFDIFRLFDQLKG